LTQFDTVDTVSIRIDGSDVAAIGGEGVPAVDLDRSDFEGVTPLVLVESPVPGQRFSSQSMIELSGIANTFEARVAYSVRFGGRPPSTEGFLTASAGSGTWGDFSVSLPVPSPLEPGLGVVAAWWNSPKDGERVDVYEVPVAFV
jgi:hypothetical protein